MVGARRAAEHSARHSRLVGRSASINCDACRGAGARPRTSICEARTSGSSSTTRRQARRRPRGARIRATGSGDSSWVRSRRRRPGANCQMERDAGPGGNDDDYHYQEPPSDELAAPWNAARYEVGTGPLDDSTPVLAVGPARARMLSWRSPLCSFARFAAAATGFASRVPRVYWFLRQRRGPAPGASTRHHVYIDRTAWDHDERICAEIGEGFEFVTRHEDGKEVEDIRALINHAQSLSLMFRA